MQSRNVSWYALMVRAKFEKAVRVALEYKGYESLLPLHRQRRTWKSRSAVVETPVFGGYVFCRLEIDRQLPILTIPGVRQIVGFGGVPAAIPDDEIEYLKSVTNSGRPFQAVPYLQEGQRVRVSDGPLRGVEGILLGTRGEMQLLISIHLLRRSVVVQISRDSVQSIETPGIPGRERHALAGRAG